MRAVLYDFPGPDARRRSSLITALFIMLIALLAIWVIVSLRQSGMLDARLWYALLDPNLVQLLVSGLLSTMKVAAVSMILSIIGGAMLAACLLLFKQTWVRVLLRSWIEVFRGLPLLLLIFFIYLGGPGIGVQISTFWALVLGIVLYNSAVIAEIFRAGILALPRGQSEAGAAIGLSASEIFRLILLPQSVRNMLPALISQLVVLIKETSLGFIVGYAEFLRDARTAVEFLGGSYSLPVYTVVAVVYIAVNCALSWLARHLQPML